MQNWSFCASQWASYSTYGGELREQLVAGILALKWLALIISPKKIYTLIFISPNGSITGDYVENENRAPSPNIQLSLSVL